MASTPSKEEFSKYIASKNLSDEIHPETLEKMGRDICHWFDEDCDSRVEWERRYEEYLKLATQVKETKTFPWPKAANVKFPLLATAALQFAARAYPALVPGPNLVAGLVIGQDLNGTKSQQAQRVGRHMSYQLMVQMEDWEEDMDRLCFILPIAGCLFKKTYYDHMEEQNCSELVLPTELVIDYYAKTVESASRKSQIIWKTENEVQERINKGLFNDLNYGEALGHTKRRDAKNEIDGTKEPSKSPATPHRFIECHCYWDLDGDDYAEPYIVTVHYDTKQVARVIARFDLDGIETTTNQKTGKQTFVRIKPIEYFTKFGFIPNPDGGIYDVGFGLLLGGINESVNTLTNLLLDGGVINNLQAGFLGRGIRVRSGNTRFIPGEWKPVDFTGDDIKKHIFPLPTKEPSDVLFKLLETLVASGKELASIAEIFVGKMPGQNTPATTTMATIEQGLKVFTAIYKRIYRALGKEYEKLFKLNAIHLPDEKIYFTINEPDGPQSQQVEKQDYDLKNISIKPNADPNIVSAAQKLMKVQSYGSLLQLGTINPRVYTKRFLEAVESENIGELMGGDQPAQPGQPKQPYQPPPSPDQQKLQGEMQIKQAEAQQKAQLAQQQSQLDAAKADVENKSKQLDQLIKVADAQLKEQASRMDMMHTAQKANVEMAVKQQEHQQNLVHTQQEHQQNLRNSFELAQAKAASIKKAAEAKASAKPVEGK